MSQSLPLWSPDPLFIEQTRIHAFMAFVSERTGRDDLFDYETLYQWSVEHSTDFWVAIWDFCHVIGQRGEQVLTNGDDIEQAQWFPQAQLNFAENLLMTHAVADDQVAIYFRAENQVAYNLTYGQLREQVARTTTWLKQHGVQKGDRVAGYLPNMPETVVAMLATTSLGAIWTATSPDFGEESVIERFGQTEPVVLFTVDGYYYNGKSIAISAKVKAVAEAIPSIRETVVIPLINREKVAGLLGTPWSEVQHTTADTLDFTPCGFNDPLYILYSSGTTGKPKCITHKVGGVLLQHLKEHQLHSDVRPGDKVFYFTTCGWMMWNWLVSGLASGAALVLYEGSPFYPSGQVLWDYADEVGVTLFGTSAKYIDAMNKADLKPADTHKLTTLRTLCSTGSVLAPESYDYVYEAIKSNVCLASISGGTDIVSCFVQGCAILPVYRGELQCRGLGMAVDVFNSEGQPVRGEKGELVCTQTFPAQPACFWGDTQGEKYHNAYFAHFENIWHHGDYVELTPQGGMIIHGRSDATLNPGGVRIGTAEIYRHVEQLDAVLESIAIGQDWENDVRVILFVVLQDGYSLDESLTKTIRTTIREKCTPRHVPAKVVQVAEIPRTKSGKIVELAVREVVHNRPVQNLNALANPEALELYRDLAVLQS